MKYRLISVTASPNCSQVIGVLGKDIEAQNSLKHDPLWTAGLSPAHGSGGGNDGTDQTVSEL